MPYGVAVSIGTFGKPCPIAGYEEPMNFDVPLGEHGDVYDRYLRAGSANSVAKPPKILTAGA